MKLTERRSRPIARAIVVAGTAAALVAPARSALAVEDEGPLQIVPEKRKGKERRQARHAEDVDRSEGGTRRGILEMTLGGAVLSTSGLLIGRGVWELVESRKLEQRCAEGGLSDLECGLLLSPKRNGSIAAGLSFGFSAVLGVAGGFLLAHGVRINRDYREWTRAQARISLRPWASIRQPSAGLSLRLRF